MARWATVCTVGVVFPAGTKKFSLLHSVQTGSGAHSAFYPMGAGGSYHGGKAAGIEADFSPPSSTEV
jgi:hypothetical protein